MASTDTPKPTTAIPELAAMDLTDEEFQTVVACENAVTSLLIGMLMVAPSYRDRSDLVGLSRAL